MYIWYLRLVYAACVLALCVVVFGAYVRLSDAGLGCPDWPGCYGHLVLPADDAARASAQAAYPDRALEAGKAWREMIHRYLASTLGFLILLIAALAWLDRQDPRQPVVLPLLLLGVVIFQGLLGMWTVTLLLKPLIVMAHLIGGLTTTAMLFWLILEHRRRDRRPVLAESSGLAIVGLAVLVLQIALGGWTSSNYAALACPDLPTCGGEWFPSRADFSEAFVMWRGLGIDYEGGVLEAPARVAIHYTHRLGALLATLVLGFLGIRYLRDRRPELRRAARFVLLALAAQVSLGISIVWFGLPLPLATAHNGVAALLLLATLNLLHSLRRTPAAV
ncbi:MAG: heme A synthase [Gammaproteobacteria bacterium]|nr:MAG: heme A synthase [Gammaproteobacteria bacterium]